MTDNPADRLLRSALQRLDAPPTPDSAHFDETRLAAFVEGALSEEEYQQAVEHLADCAPCRQAVAILMEADEPAPRPGRESRAPFRGPLVRTLIAASVLCVAFGATWLLTRKSPEVAEREAFVRGEQLLVQADFPEVEQLVAAARQSGIQSSRLVNLEAEARRGLPSRIALQSRGCVADFGWNPDGIIARGGRLEPGLPDAARLLDQVPDRDKDLDVRLNLAHVHLSQGDIEQAAREFAVITQTAPRNPWGWLGLGLAEFVQERFEAAEHDFRQALAVDPELHMAKVNLAIVLEEAGRTREALALWRELRKERLSGREGQLVTEALERFAGRESDN